MNRKRGLEIIILDDPNSRAVINGEISAALRTNTIQDLLSSIYPGSEPYTGMTFAQTAEQVTRVIQNNYQSDPILTQIVVTSYHLTSQAISYNGGSPEMIENGADLARFLRACFINHRMGSLILIEDREKDVLKSTRFLGVCEKVQIDEGYLDISEAMRRMILVMISRERREGQKIEHPMIVKRIETIEEFEAYLRLRYMIYDYMNYIPHQTKMGRTKIEVDEFDTNAIPCGAFEITPEGRRIVATSRVILETRQEPYASWIRDILTRYNETRVLSIIEPYPGINYPTEQAFSLRTWCENQGLDYGLFCEPSRIISHLDHRGSGVSRAVAEIAIATLLYSAKRYGFGANDPKHTAMYERYGFRGIPLTQDCLVDPSAKIIDGNTIMVGTVGNMSQIVVGDFFYMPEPTKTNVESWIRMFNSGTFEALVNIDKTNRFMRC